MGFWFGVFFVVLAAWNLHSGARYEFSSGHLAELRALEVEKVSPERYLLIVRDNRAAQDEVQRMLIMLLEAKAALPPPPKPVLPMLDPSMIPGLPSLPMLPMHKTPILPVPTDP